MGNAAYLLNTLSNDYKCVQNIDTYTCTTLYVYSTTRASYTIFEGTFKYESTVQRCNFSNKF